jgi:hypothetical protein
MRNQPLDITMMINKRIKARARRQAAFEAWTETKEDIKRESAFERNLVKLCGQRPDVFPLGLAFDNVQEWCMCSASSCLIFFLFLGIWMSMLTGGSFHSRTDDCI